MDVDGPTVYIYTRYICKRYGDDNAWMEFGDGCIFDRINIFNINTLQIKIQYILFQKEIISPFFFQKIFVQTLNQC